MRALIGPDGPVEQATDADLRRWYAAPATPWLRVNMISSLDGAATGESGRSGSLNNAVDHRVFHLLRDLAEVIVVGAGTAQVEGYRGAVRPLVVVSRRGRIPDGLRDAAPGAVLLATCAEAPGLPAARALLGEEHVLVLGADRVDLAALRPALRERGYSQVLGEGGPRLLRDLLAAGVVDELCATVVPRLVAGPGPRITDGLPVDVPLRLELLLEEAGTLLGRWFT